MGLLPDVFISDVVQPDLPSCPSQCKLHYHSCIHLPEIGSLEDLVKYSALCIKVQILFVKCAFDGANDH